MQTAVFKRYLSHMAWANTSIVDFGDLAYLGPMQYEKYLRNLLSRAQLWNKPMTAMQLNEVPRGQVSRHCKGLHGLQSQHISFSPTDGSCESSRALDPQVRTDRNIAILDATLAF